MIVLSLNDSRSTKITFILIFLRIFFKESVFYCKNSLFLLLYSPGPAIVSMQSAISEFMSASSSKSESNCEVTYGN